MHSNLAPSTHSRTLRYTKTLSAAAQVGWKFLLSRSSTKTAPPNTWDWGIISVTAHKRASTTLKPHQGEETPWTFPSSSLFVFAITALRPAPIAWEDAPTPHQHREESTRSVPERLTTQHRTAEPTPDRAPTTTPESHHKRNNNDNVS